MPYSSQLMKQLLLSIFTISAISGYAQTWTWINGDTVANVLPVYGTKGISAPTNQPGGRVEGAFWTDRAGKLWLYGGNREPSRDKYADLWKYDPVTGEWTWMQ